MSVSSNKFGDSSIAGKVKEETLRKVKIQLLLPIEA
jgi:hypothetical protein